MERVKIKLNMIIILSLFFKIYKSGIILHKKTHRSYSLELLINIIVLIKIYQLYKIAQHIIFCIFINLN